MGVRQRQDGPRRWMTLLVTAALCARAVAVHAQAPPTAAATAPAAAQIQRINPALSEALRQVVNPPGQCARLPVLAGQNVDEILPRLSSRLWRPEVREQPSSAAPRTILQEPTTALVDGRLCSIEFVVSDGSLTYVPNVYRATRVEAEEQLAAAGLEMRPLESPSEQPPGTAVNQEPGPKSEVRRGSAVAVWFAAPTLYELPNVIGQEIRAARRALRPFEVRVEPVAGLQPRGEITGQTPAGPSQQPRGAEVVLEVSDGSLVRVPPLIGSTREEASQRLADADLQIAVVEAPSEEPAGRVFKQGPDPEQVVTRRSVVEVVIAIPTLYEVPNVIGLQLQDAVRRLRGFTVGRNEVPSSRPRGEVTDQEPRAPVQLPARAEVRLDISDGSLVRVPGVEQQPLDKARAELGRADLQAAVAEREGELAPGMVATQDPPAGRQVKRGSAVRLAVSTGIEVPQVVGVQVKDARTLLSRFDVREVQVANVAPRGEIVTQRPDPGTRVAARSPVEIEISDGSRVLVPELKTKSLAEARAALEQVELVANPEPKEGVLESDTVASQDPAAGVEASRGDAVRVVVSTGIELPNVVGTPVVEATQRLAGFTVTTKDVPGQQPKGQVVKQEPAAGTRVAADASVGLEVSDGLLTPPTPRDDVTGPVDDRKKEEEPTDGIPWLWILGGLAALGAGVPLVRGIRKMIRPPMSYRARFETELDSVRIGEVTADGAGIRIAARFEFGESTVRFDGDSS